MGASGARSGTTRVRVSWSPAGVTADDVLVDRVAALDVVTVVVTDDLELRERVRAVGANVVGSRTLLTTVQ